MGTLAKELRKRSTDAENRLWMSLQRKQLGGLKFRRQEPIGNYIVDFVCYEKRLVIELDGGQHLEQKEKDQIRDQWLKGEGFTVLRFWNNQVLQMTKVVLETIWNYCHSLEEKNPHPPLNPLPSREGKYQRL